MNLVGGLCFAAVAFTAGILLIAFRARFAAASARIQVRYYGRAARKTAQSSTPGVVAVIGCCFLAFGILSPNACLTPND